VSQDIVFKLYGIGSLTNYIYNKFLVYENLDYYWAQDLSCYWQQTFCESLLITHSTLLWYHVITFGNAIVKLLNGIQFIL